MMINNNDKKKKLIPFSKKFEVFEQISSMSFIKNHSEMKKCIKERFKILEKFYHFSLKHPPNAANQQDLQPILITPA